MRVPVKPDCTIDWRRFFTLPVCVPPASLADDKRLVYINALAASAEIVFNTFDRFSVAAPLPREVRGAPKGAPSQVMLPGLTANVAVSDERNLPATASGVVTTNAFHATPPNAPAAGLNDDQKDADIASQLEAKLPRDRDANQFTSIPMPFAGLDTVRFYFGDAPEPDDALGLNEAGMFPDGDLAAALPATLLATRDDDGEGNVDVGEIDPLLLRAPVAGRFRFEPYYIYRADAGAFKPVGPSSSGRVLVQQPALSTQERTTDRTDTLVYRQRTFAFDHVDRDSVAPLIHAHLMHHVRFLDGFADQFNKDDRLGIAKTRSEVLGWIATDVNHLLRSWTAFLTILRWRPEDVTVDGEMHAEWKDGGNQNTWRFPPADQSDKDAKRLVPMVTEILGKDAWLESLRFFSENVYSPLLAGQTWLEVLSGLRDDTPAVPHFPISKDQPPFTPATADNKKIARQHERLRQLEDPRRRWIACYAGAPIGKPALVYVQAPAGGERFPANGLTAYEVEALHAAGTAAATLALGAAVAAVPGPSAGVAMDLSPYDGKRDGYACLFSASELAANPLHTTVDFLWELTIGTHFRQDEEAFVDLHALEDPDTALGHPLLEPLHADEQHRAVELRRQMDVLNATTIADDTLAWWDGKLGFTKVGGKWHHLYPPDAMGVQAVEDVGPSPKMPYRDGKTHPNTFAGVLTFDDLMFGPQSGFDVFDLTSAFLACFRMSDPVDGGPKLPLPVLLALMEREGVKQFGPINRHVRFTVSEAATLVWEALRTGAADVPGPRPHASYFTDAAGQHDDFTSREAWLSYPYGVDTFARRQSDANFRAGIANLAGEGVITLDGGEDVGRYIRQRVWSAWRVITGPPDNKGLPKIWKRHRRMHWAGLSLMAGFFRLLEHQMLNASEGNGFAEAGWAPDAGWLPAGSSPPDLAGKSPNDGEWKDFLTYYGLIYIAYNAGAGGWRGFVRRAQAAHGASPLSLRDFLMFKREREAAAIGHACRFMIGLDDFLRLNLLDNITPKQYAATNPDVTAIAANRWGL